MKNLLIAVIFVIASFSLMGQPKVKTGLEVLRDSGFDILKGKRVGLVTNPTGVDANLKSTIDILYENKSIQLKALFGPEHGVRGDFAAGDHISNNTDKVTGLPVYSLYGENRKPTKEMLTNLDILVYDIQDIGCRSYTYISTLGMVMEAAAENNIPVVVLDRPNPLGGNRIEGNLTEPEYVSFISQFPIPYVYGLTCGELAQFLNGQKILKGGITCNLTVIPMHGWKRTMSFEETGLPWVLTSPHVPHAYSPFYYVASGVLGELGVINEGVGYTLPFQLFGAEWINGMAIANELNGYNLPGVEFRALSYKPFYGKLKDKALQGLQIYIKDYASASLMDIQFAFILAHNKLYTDKNVFSICAKDRLKVFDKVCGNSKIRELLQSNSDFKTIQDYLKKDVQKFREISTQYHLY